MKKTLLLLAFLATFPIFSFAQTNSNSEIPLVDIDGPEQKVCVRDDVPYLDAMILANKPATLLSIRTQSLQRMQENAGLPYYLDKRSYAHIEVGNLFNAIQKHAVIAYLSNAYLLENTKDYYLNLYVYEVRNNTLFQVFKAENLSSYFQNVGLDISDFNQDGVADILVATSEPEWYHGDRPTGTYYHLFQYTPQQSTTLFTPLPLLTPIANPKFISPQIVFSLSDCGCGGYCWFSKLYLLQGNTTQQIAEAGQYCTNMAQVYQFNEQGKTMIAELMHTETGDSQFIENVWRELMPKILPNNPNGVVQSNGNK